MKYNIDFLTASLLFLLLILYHFVSRKKLRDSKNRIFSLVILLGIMDVIFDLATTLLICAPHPSLALLTRLLLTIFYILQIMVPYTLFLYTWSLGGTSADRERIPLFLLSLPAVFMWILVLQNFYSGIIFSVDRGGGYIHGPLYLSMYCYAGIYGFLVLVCSVLRYQKLGRKNFLTVCEFLLIMASCVAVQAWQNRLLTTGLGLGLGITALYLTISNPSDYTDRLTGDFNLRNFLDYMPELFRRKKSFHLLSVTIRNLTQINLLFGIRFGDSFLCSLSQQMNEILESPYVFRVSSRRFILLTHSLEEYERVRTRLTGFFGGSLSVNNEQLPLCAVINGIINAETLKDCDTLLSYIDYLASLAPEATETSVVQSDENIRKGFQYHREIEGFLRTAIEEDLFEVYFQPLYHLEKEDYLAAEALSRLRHPVLGWVFPELFISIAEHSGQIGRIGQLQFRKVCRFVADHPELLARLRYISFNLSPAELLQENYVQRLVDIIREYSLPFSFFRFEITETVATEYSDQLYRLVKYFSGCGIQLSLDDFGAGYANLNTVLRLPFRSVKLDRSLLADIMEDEKALLFYQNIVAALRRIGYQVISEGAEEKSQIELLQNFGVDMVQGYYYSRPLSREDFLQLLFPD